MKSIPRMHCFALLCFADGNTQIVHDSQNYDDIEYSGMDGFEVTNNATHARACFHGPLAVDFRDNSAKAIAANHSLDAIEGFLGGFDSLMTLPTDQQ
jgi:hypothetical protein